MTPIKETLEIGNSSANSEISPGKNRPKPEAAHLRSDAVSLDVPVKVHGSLMANLSPGATPHAEPFEEQTSTMIVFPQGGVLKMSTAVSEGQVMVLTNLKSSQDAICRVVKVRAYGNGQSYVEVEFTSRQPGYWGVYFSSDGPETTKKSDTPSAAAPPAEKPASDVSRAPAPAEPSSSSSSSRVKQPDAVVGADSSQQPAPASRRPAQSNLPESSFVSIGSQEEVQPAASATGAARAIPSFESHPKPPASADRDTSGTLERSLPPSSSMKPAVSMEELPGEAPVALPKTEASGADSNRVDAAEPPLPKAPLDQRSGSTTTVTAAAADNALPAPREMFGVSLDSNPPAANKPVRSNRSRIFIPIGIAALLAAIAGGAFYFHSRFAAGSAAHSVRFAPATAASATSAPTPNVSNSMPPNATAPAVPSTGAGAQQSSGQPGLATQSAPPVLANEAMGTPKPEAAPRETDTAPKSRSYVPAARQRQSSSPISGQDAGSSQNQAPVAIPSTFGILNTRPVVTRHDDGNIGSAPALESSAPTVLSGSALSAIAPPPNLPAPPRPVAKTPVRVGGDVLPPRLVSSVLPDYPALARNAGVEGTVVIDTTIDKNGRVANMKVVSGPEILRQSALNALRQWKYAPSKLNGQPIPVEMIVSIQFHR